MTARIPRHLEHTSARLSERDWAILASLKECRYLTTKQLARQFFGMEKTATATPRQANHAFARLRSLGLTSNLLRRIGGVRAGSAGHVWALTDTGSRLLAWHEGHPADPRIREYEPSPAFLDHTLAVAEVVLDLTEAAAAVHASIERVQFEPAAWRKYLSRSGVAVFLKPDLAATTRVCCTVR
ncbi:MAG: replication-relaxation family protein [Leucobacter sp.]